MHFLVLISESVNSGTRGVFVRLRRVGLVVRAFLVLFFTFAGLFSGLLLVFILRCPARLGGNYVPSDCASLPVSTQFPLLQANGQNVAFNALSFLRILPYGLHCGKFHSDFRSDAFGEFCVRPHFKAQRLRWFFCGMGPFDATCLKLGS